MVTKSRTPEDDLWLEAHYACGQINMLKIRAAFRSVDAKLVKDGYGDPELWGRIARAYVDENRDSQSAREWHKFRTEADHNAWGAIPAETAGYSEELIAAQMAETVHFMNRGAMTLKWTAVEGYGDRVTPPRYAMDGDAGIDVAVCGSAVLMKGDQIDIPLGIRVEPPAGYWYLIHGRSSAINRGIQVATGVIDEGYRGPLFARVVGLWDNIQIKEGDRLCQLILFPLIRAEAIVHVDELTDTERGHGGFGSTGH